MNLNNHSKGFALIGILIALAIILILTGHYFTKDEETQVTYYQTQIDKSKSVACTVNRQQLSASITAWSISHPGEKVTVEKLRHDRYSVPRCPSGVDYIIDTEGHVYCPTHFPPPWQKKSQQTGRVKQNRAPAGIPAPASAPAAATLDRVRRQLEQK